jgi:hypothetical protein
MKKALFLAIATITFSSCAHVLYSPETMEYYQNIRMKSQDELLTKARVKVYTSEKDVPGNYEVVAVNVYNPFRFPIFMSYRKQMTKKFYQKAITKAYEQGGNGIIVTAAGLYKVINITDLDTDNVTQATYINPIFDRYLMDKFGDGEISKTNSAGMKRFEADFMDEINSNIKTAKTIDETDFVAQKLGVLETYNNSWSRPSNSIKKYIADSRKALSKAINRINRQAAKRK